MKDEIKELLELTIQFVEEELDKGTPKKDIIKVYSIKVGEAFNHIKYYITNLQKENKKQEELISRLYSAISDDEENFKLLEQENERLKEIVENLTTMTVCGDRKQIKNSAQYKLDIYKSRNEKAIEKLKTLIPICIMPNNTLIHGTEKAKTIEEALNILEGDKDE